MMYLTVYLLNIPVFVSDHPGQSQRIVQLVDGSKWGAIPSLHDCESDIMINQAGRVTSFQVTPMFSACS